LSAGSRRNGSSKFGPFNRSTPTLRDRSGHEKPTATHAADGRAHEYTGRHAIPRGKTTRKRVGKVVPAAAVAAAVVAGAASYSLAGSSKPDAAHLNDAFTLPGASASPVIGAGHAKSASSTLIQATKKAVSDGAKSAAKHKAAATHTASASAAAAAEPATHTAAATPASTPSTKAATPTASATQATTATLSCNGGGLLPANVTAIVSFLLANGYSHNAAAGIAGNIYQESKGDPESIGMGGGGLIGWTPLPSGFVTGNYSADLQTQLAALLTYNQGWSGYLPALNSASSPASAAYIYVTDFERAGIPAASTREQAATDVAAACGI
jgi:Phage tail lysozyme